MNNEKSLAQLRDAERMANAAPRKDAGPISESDIHAGAPQDREAKRVREHRAQQYREWHFRAKGRQPSDAEVNAFLEGGAR